MLKRFATTCWFVLASFAVGITLGYGKTGRILPKSLNEQMAMEQVLSNPLNGNVKPIPLQMTDSRWSKSDGWIKMQNIVEHTDGTKTNIHFVYNTITGAFDDFKFK